MEASCFHEHLKMALGARLGSMDQYVEFLDKMHEAADYDFVKAPAFVDADGGLGPDPTPAHRCGDFWIGN